MYLLLAEIKDSTDFIEAVKSVGWHEDDYKEVLDALGNRGTFIVNYSVSKEHLPNKKKLHTGCVYVCDGDENISDDWCLLRPTLYTVDGKSFWVKDKDIELD